MKKKIDLEFEGSSVEDAITNALKQLKLKRENIKVEVLCEEKRGLFGMAGEKPAKIKVTVLEDSQKKP